MSSDEIPSNVQTVSSVQTSLELPLSLHASSSAEALVARDTIGSEVMPYEGGAKSEGSDVPKSASGFYTAIETGRGEALVMEGEGVSLPTSKELIEVRQRKKVSELGQGRRDGRGSGQVQCNVLHNCSNRNSKL